MVDLLISWVYRYKILGVGNCLVSFIGGSTESFDLGVVI